LFFHLVDLQEHEEDDELNKLGWGTRRGSITENWITEGGTEYLVIETLRTKFPNPCTQGRRGKSSEYMPWWIFGNH
jgi:hypothetical protein